MASQDTTFSSGATLRRGENEREMDVPPSRGSTTWLALLFLPVFAFIVFKQFRESTDTGDRVVAGIMMALAVWGVLQTIDTLTRRTRFALTRTSVSMSSVGLLGVRAAACDRGAFRFGRHVHPRRGWPYTELFFGDRRMKVCYGWDEQNFTGVLIELQEWAQMPTTPGAPDDVVLVNSRLRIAVDGHDRSVEIPPPRRNFLLWAALPALPLWAGVWVYGAMTFDTRPDDVVILRFFSVAMVLIAIILVGKSIDLLTTHTRISVTRKYVALSSKGLFTRKSYTCARGDFTIGGYQPVTKKSPISGLELLFGSTTALVLKGGDSRDVAEVIDVLESWLLQA